MNSIMFVGMPRCFRPTRSGRYKWRFRSELAALMVAYGFAHEGRRFRQSKVRYAYQCPACEGWHLTKRAPVEKDSLSVIFAGEDPPLLASPARIRWASLLARRRGKVPPQVIKTVSDGRELCREAQVSLASLFLPDPSRKELFLAWLGITR